MTAAKGNEPPPFFGIGVRPPAKVAALPPASSSRCAGDGRLTASLPPAASQLGQTQASLEDAPERGAQLHHGPAVVAQAETAALAEAAEAVPHPPITDVVACRDHIPPPATNQPPCPFAQAPAAHPQPAPHPPINRSPKLKARTKPRSSLRSANHPSNHPTIQSPPSRTHHAPHAKVPSSPILSLPSPHVSRGCLLEKLHVPVACRQK